MVIDWRTGTLRAGVWGADQLETATHLHAHLSNFADTPFT
jgi:hypothetical protein